MDEKGNGHFPYPYVRIVTFSFPSFWFGFKPRWMETLTPPHIHKCRVVGTSSSLLQLKSLLLAKPPPWPWTSRHNAIDFSNLDLQPPLTADVVVLLQLLPPIMVSFDRSIIKRVYYHRAAAAAFHHLVSIHSDAFCLPNKKHNQWKIKAPS